MAYLEAVKKFFPGAEISYRNDDLLLLNGVSGKPVEHVNAAHERVGISVIKGNTETFLNDDGTVLGHLTRNAQGEVVSVEKVTSMSEKYARPSAGGSQQR